MSPVPELPSDVEKHDAQTVRGLQPLHEQGHTEPQTLATDVGCDDAALVARVRAVWLMWPMPSEMERGTMRKNWRNARVASWTEIGAALFGPDRLAEFEKIATQLRAMPDDSDEGQPSGSVDARSFFAEKHQSENPSSSVPEDEVALRALAEGWGAKNVLVPCVQVKEILNRLAAQRAEIETYRLHDQAAVEIMERLANENEALKAEIAALRPVGGEPWLTG